MQYKGNYLFDIDKLLARPIPEQAKFEQDYKHFLMRMPGMVLQAYRETDDARKRKKPKAINKNWFSNEMSGNLACIVGEEFTEYVKQLRGTYCLNLNYQYECYVKRLTENGLRPMYKHSNASWANINQKTSSAKELIPVIYIGYTAKKTNDMITGCYAVCIKGKERLWVSDLTALMPPMFGENNNAAPVTPDVDMPVVRVSVRAKKDVK